MRTRIWVTVLLVLLAAGGFAVGRGTAGTGAARSRGYADGWSAGHADGVREGRALQGTQGLPADSRRQFDAGYSAGANDVFGGYDGGWDFSAPYVIVLVPGGTGIAYRIETRTRLLPGVDYYLCADRHTLCQEPRR